MFETPIEKRLLTGDVVCLGPGTLTPVRVLNRIANKFNPVVAQYKTTALQSFNDRIGCLLYTSDAADE